MPTRRRAIFEQADCGVAPGSLVKTFWGFESQIKLNFVKQESK